MGVIYQKCSEEEVDIGKLYDNPQELTPVQYKYAEEYMKKSGDSWEEYKDIPVENHFVFEWDDGWVDYRIYDEVLFDLKGKRQYKRIFWIYSLFAKSNSIKRFKDIEAVARDKYDCHVVRFQTLRNDKAWERALKIFKPKVIQSVFEMEVPNGKSIKNGK